MIIKPSNEKLVYNGRIDWNNPNEPIFIFPCTSVCMHFRGNTLKAYIKNYNVYWNNYIGYILDGKQYSVLLSKEGKTTIEFSVETSNNDIHEILLFKRQDSCHEFVFMGMEIGENDQILDIPKKYERKIEVYGDSVSAGEVSEAVEYIGKEDPDHNGEYSNSWYSYAWITARKLNAQIHDIAQGGIALMNGTGYFCEPTAIGMENVWDKVHYNPVLAKVTKWDFSKYIPQVVIVAIGQNDNYPKDYMKGNFNGQQAIKWRNHYKMFLENLRKVYKDTYIICCTTLLYHDKSWDDSISQVVNSMNDKKITQYIFKRNGVGTPGHLRISEANEMATELTNYIESLNIEEWQ